MQSQSSFQWMCLLGSASVVVFVSAASGADEHVKGKWSSVFDQSVTIDAEHMILLRTGKVLLVDGDTPTFVQLFDPSTDTFGTAFPGPRDEQFEDEIHRLSCAGHVPLEDGNILFVGGDGFGTSAGNNKATLYDPDVVWDPEEQTTPWIPQNVCPAERYYPTLTRLGNGKVLAVAGSCGFQDFPLKANIPNVYDVNAGM